MKIGIDIDDVAADFISKFLDFYNLRTGGNVRRDEVRNYNLWENNIGLRDKEHAVKVIDEFYESEFYEQIEAVSGSAGVLEKLCQRHELSFITSRLLRFREKTDKFLRKNFPNVPPRVFYSGDFHDGNGKSKFEICRELGIAVYIEDNKDYAREIADLGIRVLLFDCPWNQDHEEHTMIARIRDWREILERIQEDENVHARN